MNAQDAQVVFGAGPLGLAVVHELLARGKHVRVVSRTGQLPALKNVEIVKADAVDPSSARQACRDAAVVYHCANPPYHRWPVDFPPLHKSIVDAAAAAGAKLIFGDNLYAYGPVAQPLTESLPYQAQGPNGRTRAQMASMLLEEHQRGRVRAAIGRASDFYGPHVVNSTVGERVFGAAVRGQTAQVLGNPDLAHTYTFIRDFARGLITLGERDEALGQAWHIPSAETLTTRQFVERVFKEAGTPMRLSAAPRALVTLLAVFNPTLRALKEQLYQLERPFVMDHTKFAAAFGVQVTSHVDAIRETLNWYTEGDIR